MKIKYTKIKQSITLGIAIPLAFPIHAFGWQKPSFDVGQTDVQNKLASSAGMDLGEYNDLVTLNEDVGLMEVYLTAEEAKTSPMVKLTRKEPVVMAIEDSSHNRASIQAITSKRHSDGSATIRQKTITPLDLKRQSEGGMLTDKQYEIFIGAYGGTNPAAAFDGKGGDRNVWYGSHPHEVQTMMGLIMQFLGSTHGYYVLLEPKVRSWTTSSGGPFKKKITTHVETHVKPHWYFITPLDVGTEYGAPNIPIFHVEGQDGKYYTVSGGVNSFELGPTNNFSTSKEKLHYEKKTESGWTGFALVVGAALTGGVAFAVAAAVFLKVNGAELHQPVAANFGDLLLKSMSAGIDTREKKIKSGFGNRWRGALINEIRKGPLGGNKNYNTDMKKEPTQWETIIKPL